MTIDKEQLISLLIDKTGLESEEVESQLSELISRIRQAAEKGKTFEIEGFGVFSMDDGNLQFEPHDTLETEINNKYAGMKPIELIGAFKDPKGDEVPEMPDEELEKSEGRWAFDKSAMEDKDEPVAEKSDTEEEQQELVKQFEEKQQESTPEIPEENVDEVFGTQEKDEDDSDDKEPTEEKQATPVSLEKDNEPEQDPIGRLLVAVVIVIAVGVGGWLMYDTGILTDSNNTKEISGQSTQQSGPTPTQQTANSQQDNVPPP